MRLLILVLTLVLFHSCSAQEDETYLFSYFTGNGSTGLHFASSEDGLKWEALNSGEPVLTPAVGKDKLMRDPCIIQGPDGRFHMVWTTGWWDRYIGYAWSDDLLHWSDQVTIPVMMHEPKAKNSWAPELFYDSKNREFLIFWATTIPGRHTPVAESEREKGLNHRIYFTKTRDFSEFEPTRMFFNPDFSVIDATILEKDGEYIMFIKNENPNPPEKNIRFTTAKTPAGPYPVVVSDPITGNYWAEGPTAVQIGEYIYVYFDKYRDHHYGAVRSKDLNEWEDVSDLVSFPSGVRHGTVFKVKREVVTGMAKHGIK